jgi:hypothetical protein
VTATLPSTHPNADGSVPAVVQGIGDVLLRERDVHAVAAERYDFDGAGLYL